MCCSFCEGFVLDGFPYKTCSRCGAKCLHPIPDENELRAYYNSSYKVPRIEVEKGIAVSAPRVLAELDLHRDGSKLLEVGCSYGFFLNHARRRGWEVVGIELDQEAVAFGKRQFGLDIYSGTIEESKDLSPPYDVIAAFHVIEHVIDPMRFLNACRSFLRRNGVMMLKTPNAASWVAKCTGQHWIWHCPPAHIHLFTPQALKLAAEKSGFAITCLRTQRGDSGNNLFELIAACGRWYYRRNHVSNGAHTGVSSRRSVKLIRTLTDVAYWPCTMALDPWLDRGGSSPEIVMIARSV
jgi:2-polyprenyl-3-methyl-5-hydroxy-6-metoxy-1,4-benzoquinol methylase